MEGKGRWGSVERGGREEEEKEGERREREGKTKRGKQRTEKEWIKIKKGGKVKVKKQGDKRWRRERKAPRRIQENIPPIHNKVLDQKDWVDTHKRLASYPLTHPVLFMLGSLERESWEAHRWLRLPPNRKEERELLRLEVRELLVRDVGTSIKALIG